MATIAARAKWLCLLVAACALLYVLTRERASTPAVETVSQGEADNPPAHGQPGLTVRPERPPSDARRLPPGSTRVRLLAKETREPIANARWRIDRHGHAVAEGTASTDGVILLSAAAVDAWEHSRLRIWAEGRRDEHAPMPKDARGKTVEVLLAKFHVDFAGVVLDDAGRPIEGAAVLIAYWNALSSSMEGIDDLYRTRTNARGQFRLSAKVWHPDIEGVDGHTLWAAAPGFVPARLTPDKRGKDGLVVRLARDQEGQVVELRAFLPDGTPARQADAWIGCRPRGDPARRFAELWRESSDTRPPGWKTWPRIGKREAWWLRLDANGCCTLNGVPPGRHRLQVLASGHAADLEMSVQPAHTAQRVNVTLEPLREVTGAFRVGMDPGWQCKHAAHAHVLHYSDWPAPPEPRVVPSGTFRLTDLPPGVTSLTASTAGHPDVVVELPETGPAALGELVVPTARVLEGLLRWPRGRKPESWSGVRLVDREGVVASTTTYYTTGGGPRFELVLPRRPAPDAWLIVRLRMREGDRSPEVRLDGPFDFVSGRALDLALPDATPGRGK